MSLMFMYLALSTTILAAHTLGTLKYLMIMTLSVHSQKTSAKLYVKHHFETIRTPRTGIQEM